MPIYFIAVRQGSGRAVRADGYLIANHQIFAARSGRLLADTDPKKIHDGQTSERGEVPPGTYQIGARMGLTDANRLKFTPDGSKVLILDGGTGTLVVIDAASHKAMKQLKVADRDTGDGGMFVMPDGSRAYLGLRDDHSVVEVNLKTLEIANRFPMGADSGPGCINWASLK